MILTRISSICSGELLNKKFLVPCNTAAILRSNYGEGWNKPLESHYAIPNKPRAGQWSLDSSEYKRYNAGGNYDRKGTASDLEKIKKSLKIV